MPNSIAVSSSRSAGHAHAGSGRYYRRFGPIERVMHAFLMLTFIGCALTGVPLLFAGQAIGALSVYTGQPYRFSNEEIGVLGALAELSAIAVDKARLYERIVDVEELLRQNV